MSTKKQTEADAAEKFFREAFENMNALQALMRRKNDAMVRVAVLVGELQRKGQLTDLDGAAFDAIFADFGPAEEGPLSARWARMIAEAKAAKVRVTEN